MNIPSGNSLILTIDLGTSGPKVALFDTKGNWIDHAFAPTPVNFIDGGGAEQDPDGWWQAIVSAWMELKSRNIEKISQIKAISTTAQWSGTVPVDKNGKAIYPCINWMDSRGAPYIKNITSGWPMVEGYGLSKLLVWLYKTGGVPTHSGKDPIAHILFIKSELPEIYAATHKFLEPKDYINCQLTGKFTSTFETMLLHWVTQNRNINKIRYDDRLLKMSGLPKEKLPEMFYATDVIGTVKPDVAETLGLPEGVQVMGGTPDLQSAAVGSGAVRNFEGHLYVGTSSWIGAHVPFKKTDIFHNIASLPSPVHGQYLITNEQETGGAGLNYFRDNLFFHKDLMSESKVPDDFFKLINEQIEKVPAGSKGVIFTPWLIGERSPVEDHTVRGAFLNLSQQTDRTHMLRAAMEGVAFNSKWLLKYVEKMAGKPFPYLNFIGGGAKSDVWCQIMADVLDRPIRQVEDPIIANSRGAAFLAAVGLGYTTFEDISQIININHTFEPNPANRTIYDKMFREFVNIYYRLKPVYKRLNAKKQ